MTGILYALGGFCARRPYPVAVTWLVIVVGFVAVVNSVGKQTSDNLTLPGTGSTQAQDLLEDNLPKQANGTNPVVMETSTGKLTTGKNEQAVKATVELAEEGPPCDQRGQPAEQRGRGCAQQGQANRLHLGDDQPQLE